jgi:hypothetical protein
MVPGRSRRRSLILFAGGAVLGGATARPRVSKAASLTPDDTAKLRAGEVVSVPLDVDLDEGSYFGGVAYALVPASVTEVAGVINDPGTYPSILPKTLESRVLGSVGDDRRVYFRQGGNAGSAAYVLFVRRESLGLFRFWLDKSAAHDIADLWGYFDVQPYADGSLLTYAALVRLDFGIVKLLFSGAIRRFAMTTPGLVRAYVEAHRGHPG